MIGVSPSRRKVEEQLSSGPRRHVGLLVLVEGVAMAGVGVGAGCGGRLCALTGHRQVRNRDSSAGRTCVCCLRCSLLGAAVIGSAVLAARAARVNAVEAL